MAAALGQRLNRYRSLVVPVSPVSLLRSPSPWPAARGTAPGGVRRVIPRA